jgi:hypothetical protein
MILSQFVFLSCIITMVFGVCDMYQNKAACEADITACSGQGT